MSVDPIPNHGQVPLGLGVDKRQHDSAPFEHSCSEFFLQHGTTDEDLLLRGEECLHQLIVAAGQPPDPKTRQAVRLRHRRHGEHAGRQGRRHRQRVTVGHLSVRLINEKSRSRMALDKSDESLKFTSRVHAARGVVRIGDADEARFLPEPCRQVLHIETPSILESKLDGFDVCADGSGSLKVCCVVGRTDERVCLRTEERSGDDEVIRRERVAIFRDQRAQALCAQVIAVRKQNTS